MKRMKILAVLILSVSLLAGCGQGLSKDPMTTYAPETTIEPTVIPATINPEDNVTPEEIADSLTVENVSPYTGAFVECDPEDRCRAEGIYALEITNISDETILNAVLNYNDGTNDLVFYIEMLPKRQTIVVAEQNMQKMTSEELTFTGGAVNYLEEGMEAMDLVEITPTKNSTLMVKNISEEKLPITWIFYRQVDREGRVLGGRCSTAMVGDLPPGFTYEAEAPEWLPSCVIVNALVLDEPIQ